MTTHRVEDIHSMTECQYLTKDFQNTLRIPVRQKTTWYPGLNPGSEKGH